MKRIAILSLVMLLLTCWSFNRSAVAYTNFKYHEDSHINFQLDSIQNLVNNDSLEVSKNVNPANEKNKDGKDGQLKPPSFSEVVSGEKIFWSVVFLFLGYLIIKIITRIINFFAEKSNRYRITLKSLIPVIKVTGWAVTVFLITSVIIQPPPQSLIAVSASLAVAVGFASQDILKNVFGGIIILLERPFNVGDKIEVNGQYGEVTEVGLRSTRMVTADDSVVVIPNGDLMSKSLSNSNSGEPNCQVVSEIYLPIDVDTAKARKIALEAARVSRYIHINKPVVALFFNEIKERRSYIKMRLKAYVFDIRDEFAFKSDMTEIVIREFLKAGLINKEELF